ncbi:MAG: glucose 1-dehydrogenase [Nitrospirae bacterium]|nr:glucose 1-dehydrogenase [Nitrospirota bacterium]
MKRLDGTVALITGGGVGIGEAVARLFAKEGAAVLITGRRKDLLERVAGEIERSGGRALAVAGSVADEAHAQTAVMQAVRTFGKLNVLVNNAGIGSFGKLLHETDDATWNELFATNLTGAFRMTRAALPEMLKAGGGAIVNVSSIASLVGIPTTAAYSATKGGLDALTRCTALDYAKQGIRCNAVNPGLVNTPMAAPLINDPARLAQAMAAYPLGRPGTPEEVAKLVLYLASDESSWVTGGVFPIDGGMTAQ